jgi:site-specific DNA-methyltransferase (adenine-specific)
MSWTLHEGDCLDVMRSMPDGSVDAVITDPPYGIGYVSGWMWADGSQSLGSIAGDSEVMTTWISEAYRLLRDASAIVVFTRWDVAEKYRSALDAAGFTVKSQVVWNKKLHGMGDLSGEFAPCHEMAWFATKGKYRFPGDRPRSVISTPRQTTGGHVHPTEKPVALLAYLARHLTREGDTILDPFAGSGSTLLAADQLDRNAIGCELDPRYCDIIRRRMSVVQGTLL